MDRGDLEPGDRLLAGQPGCAHCYAKTFAERWRGVPGHPTSRASICGCGRSGSRCRCDGAGRARSSSTRCRPVPRGHPGRVHRARCSRRCGRHTGTRSRCSRSARSGLAAWRRDLDWPPNMWMGVTIENRRFVHRADALARCPPRCGSSAPSRCSGRSTGLDLDGIDWLIAGGESGAAASVGRRASGSSTCGTAAAPGQSPSSSSSGAALRPKSRGRYSTDGHAMGRPSDSQTRIRSPHWLP